MKMSFLLARHSRLPMTALGRVQFVGIHTSPSQYPVKHAAWRTGSWSSSIAEVTSTCRACTI